MSKPLVSIITPCYNGEAFLDRYFESILAQTYSNLELIFINDGSKDRTEEIALSYTEKLQEKGIRYIYKRQENAGQAAALNRGLKLFTGKYLIWPDSDDVMTPDAIEKKVEFLEKNLEYGMVRSNGVFYDVETKKERRISTSPIDSKENIFKELLVLETFGCCGCYMITKSLFEEIYPQKQILESRCGQNWQLLVPASSRTKCGYIDEELYIIYEHADSHSRQKRSLEQEIERCEEFKDILLDAIGRSLCDQKYYQDLVRADCARQQFYYAIPLANKKVLKNKFKDLKKYGQVSKKEYLLYIKYRYLR